MTPHIFIVDANVTFRNLITHHLTTVWSQANIETAASLPPWTDGSRHHDLWFLDLASLGGADSLDSLGKLIETGAIPPVIILSGTEGESSSAACFAAGVRAFLPKRGLSHHLITGAAREFLGAPASIEQKTTSAVASHAPATAQDPDRTHLMNAQQSLTTGTIPSPRLDPSQPQSQHCGGMRSSPNRHEIPKIEGYRVIRRVGRGAMASVYLAHSEELGEKVVLKTLRIVEQVGETQGLLERFIREYELVSQINRAEIVDIYDFGQKDDFAYLTIEYFPCGDLKSRMRNPVSEEDSVLYLEQLARALGVIHDVGVLHRDLKPANVMLREDNSIALIDFGLAVSAETSMTLTVPGELFGTPSYMSPEQCLGETVDRRTDLYSLGVMFFEMLTEKKPFEARLALDVLRQQISDPIPRLPPGLQQYQPIIDGLLAKQPNERFANAHALGEALRSR